jgi:hypothetical protein
MDSFEILAIIGALAWVYPLAIWIKSLLTKTEVEIINHKDLEIGFTFYGPIINLNLAFSAEHKDAFIKNVQLTIAHEQNETSVFHWEWFEEVLLEMDIPESGIVPYRKNQKAIAIKVPTEMLIEKKVGFQSKKYKQEYSTLYSATNETLMNLTSNGIDHTQIRTSKEYNDFNDLFKKHFPWKVGKYAGTIEVFVASRNKTFKQTFSFEMTRLDLKTIEQNLSTCKQSLENHFITLDPNYKAEWKWANLLDLEK